MSTPVTIAPARGRLGVLLVGLGAVSTTTIAGVVAAWRSVRYRVLSIAFVLTVLAFAATKGRGYYTSALYPVMIAFGAVAIMRWASLLRPAFRRTIVIVLWVGILGFGAFAVCVLVPIAPSGPLKAFATIKFGAATSKFVRQ